MNKNYFLFRTKILPQNNLYFPTILENKTYAFSYFKPLSNPSNIDLKLREVYKDTDLKYGTGQR